VEVVEIGKRMLDKQDSHTGISTAFWDLTQQNFGIPDIKDFFD